MIDRTGPDRQRPQRGAEGFTLIEIMIALAIIGMTVTVILNAVNYHTKVLYENTLATQMYQLAKEKMTLLEKEPVNSKGSFESAVGITFENTASAMEETDIVELTTVVKGYGKEVVLKRLIIQ
ncbi:MAG: prepilin-type N-terminal cleavage/methylation domain-containing protein [Nitrospirota bacterium]|nr:prepilin-type N-terminal cleavage/methylation domain-containing protein [Nitrospirota bacterium]